MLIVPTNRALCGFARLFKVAVSSQLLRGEHHRFAGTRVGSCWRSRNRICERHQLIDSTERREGFNLWLQTADRVAIFSAHLHSELEVSFVTTELVQKR